MVDLDQLRATIEAGDAGALVAREWLEQVERELREGRVARALLNAQIRTHKACDELRLGMAA